MKVDSGSSSFSSARPSVKAATLCKLLAYSSSAAARSRIMLANSSHILTLRWFCSPGSSATDTYERNGQAPLVHPHPHLRSKAALAFCLSPSSWPPRRPREGQRRRSAVPSQQEAQGCSPERPVQSPSTPALHFIISEQQSLVNPSGRAWRLRRPRRRQFEPPETPLLLQGPRCLSTEAS